MQRDAVPRHPLSAAVLAGGASRRMGRDKALIELDGHPLVRRVVERLQPCSDDVFVVTKAATPVTDLGLRVVLDDIEAQTPVAGVLTALTSAQHDCVFVCACDMPFVSCGLVRLLSEGIGDADAAVPRNGGRAETLHALWSVRAEPKIEGAFRAGERAVHRVLDGLNVVWLEEEEWRPLDPSGRSFFNVNAPSDLHRARTIAAE